MEIITEDYVSFETAKLLKEKGFNEPCLSYFWSEENSNDIDYTDRPFTYKQLYNGDILRPTHQMVIKWLREVHKIFIEINVSIDLNGKYHYRYSILNKECKYIRKGYTDFDWNYEEAVEEAIKYCLNKLL